MKQGKSYFTVILWILLAAIAAYFGYHVISSLYAPLMTATVTPYEAGAGYYASGFVVREEEISAMAPAISAAHDRMRRQQLRQ